jgi:glucosyl-dolichyl phosphate glucuronosyltransferase
MNVTVILCTYNRCRSLTQALESVAACVLPESVDWEVLVVDNNSKDRTREAVEDFSHRSPGRFRYLFEPRQGKSHALNTGVREAGGEILAFLDDDVTVEPTWLQNLTAGLHSNEWAGAAGRIFPDRDVALPPWLLLEGPCSLGGALCGLFDRGDNPGELDGAPHGANMAYRKAMFEKYGCFRTDLGPPPNIHGEDTEFGQRLMRAGERLRYEPSAIVRHPVLEARLNKKYFLTWCFDHGRCTIRLREKRPPVLGIPERYFAIASRMMHLLPVRAMRWMRARDSKWRFWCKCYVWMTVGEIVEICRRPRGATNHLVSSHPEPSSSSGGNS